MEGIYVAERKTETPEDVSRDSFKNQTKQEVIFSGEKNVLNGYRSITYNFTLAALRKSLVNDPDGLRAKGLDLIILRSGGKGTSGLSGNVDAIDRKQQVLSNDGIGSYDEIVKDTVTGQNLVQGFNAASPGRFDMFIDDVEITTLMGFSEGSNVTLPTKISFEVTEPYSVNGFIEALHVSAVAAGYPSYLQASFVLYMEFWGYSDDDVNEFKPPVKIPNASRYFPLGLTGIEVDVTERGTRYRCTAVPYNERAFGQPNVLKKGISAQGKTVKDILENLLVGVTNEIKESDKKSRLVQENQHDDFKVIFPSWSEEKGFDPSTENKIAIANFVEISRDNALFRHNSPADGPKESKSVTLPKKDDLTVVQFGDNTNVHEAIISIVRDSEYVRHIIANINKQSEKIIDPYGFVNYFSVRMTVTNKDQINETTKKPFQTFTFIVSPYKIHYTKIPGLASQIHKEETLKRLTLREYNYIYTGNNVDVLNFKLQFNTLYFEAVPANMGNADIVDTKNLSARSKIPDSKLNAPPPQVDETPHTPIKVGGNLTSVKQDTPNAGQPLTEYGAFAKGMHEAITNSKASMITGEIEILGDPIYLVTGGMGGYNPIPNATKKGQDTKGEALFNYGEVLVNINFRNPIDIDTFENGGMVIFDTERVPFSGIYQITEAKSTFKNGDFKQRLNILRIPGQILDSKARPVPPGNALSIVSNPEKEAVINSTRGNRPEQRLSEGAASTQINNRGIPTSGLPGQLSNFTNASGGLGGSQPGLLSQVSGLAANALSAGSSVIGKALPSDFISNVRLSTSGLASLAQSSLGTAAITAISANVITGNLPIKQAAGVLAGAVTSGVINSVIQKSNIGSGIGEGAISKVFNDVVSTADATANDIRQGLTIDPLKLAADSVNNVTGIVQDLSKNAIDSVSNLAGQFGSLATGVGNKVSSFLGSTADPTAVAANVGINSSLISGLSPDLQSKVVDQIFDLTKNIPENVNLKQALDAGLALDYLPLSSIGNIPATPPRNTAPNPEPDIAYMQKVVEQGGITALENLYGVDSIKKLSSNIVPPNLISTAVNSTPAYQRVSFNNLSFNAVDSNVLTDKSATVTRQMSNITGQTPVVDAGIAGSVSSVYGSITQSSPLSKLINRSTGRS